MEQIIGAIIFIIIIIAQIVKSIRESSVPPQPPRGNQKDSDEVVIISRPKPSKQPPRKPQRPPERQSWRDERSVFDAPQAEAPRQKALVKKLSPQGEGQRFAVDPGTLDTSHIVAPTIDPTVKPELESITGIYEQGVSFGEPTKPAISLNLADWLAKPEGICQAVIFAEIINRPTWAETPR